MTTRKTCGSCGSADLSIVLDLGRSPLANEFPADPTESLPTYPLQMLQCGACGLAQIGEVVPDDLLWRGEYGYYSSASVALVRHFRAYAASILLRYPERARGLVVDVGCNDGTLLKHFADAGCRTIGVDPAKGPVAVAQRLGLDVRCEQFGASYANQLSAAEGWASLVLVNNVAAHVADLDNFLSGLAMMLAADGLLIMEVQYLPDLLVGNGFDMLYHEHRFFYSLSFALCGAGRTDLRIVDVDFVETQGGSIRVAVQHAEACRRDLLPRVACGCTHGGTLAGRRLLGLQFRANRIGDRLRSELHALRADGRTIAAYGAPAKATTLLHWTGTAEYISWAEDTTPAKHGRYLPGHLTPIEIRSPLAPIAPRPDAYLLTAWNYAPYILAKERDFIAAGGRFVIPLPAPITI
jgi:SAM-dependent methyltransferase